MLTKFHQAIFDRYGIVPDPEKSPEIIPFPQAQPLYKETGMTQNDYVREHGEWCAQRCFNPENEKHIRDHLKSLED